MTGRVLAEIYEDKYAGGIFGLNHRSVIVPGDRVSVCNYHWCVNYTFTEDKNWLGGDAKKSEMHVIQGEYQNKLEVIKSLPRELALDVLREQTHDRLVEFGRGGAPGGGSPLYGAPSRTGTVSVGPISKP